MIEQTGAKNLGSQMMKEMLLSSKGLAANAHEIFWEKAILKMNLNKMVELIIPIYQRHLTEEDIQATIQFYNTPTGKKFIQVSPILMQETMIVGQQWRQSIEKEIIQDLKKEVYVN